MSISLDEFKKQYSKPVSEQKKTTISLDEFKQLHGIAQPGKSRQERIEKGLPVATKRRFERTGEVEPTVGGKIVRGALSPLATLTATATSGFRKPEEKEGAIQARPMRSSYFGTTKPLQAGLARGVEKGVEKAKTGDVAGAVGETLKGAAASTVASLGTAAEIASYPVGGTPFVKGAAKLPQLANIAKTEALAGAMQAGGSSTRQAVEEAKPFGEALGDVASDTAIGGAIGAIAGPVLGSAFRVAGHGLAKTTGIGRSALSEKAVNEATNNLKELFPTTKGQRFVDNIEIMKGDRPFRLTIESGIMKEADIVNNKPVFGGTQSYKNAQQDSRNLNNLLFEALDPVVEPKLVNKSNVVQELVEDINRSSKATQQTKDSLLKKAISALEAEKLDTGNLRDWHVSKTTFWNESFNSKGITNLDKLENNAKYYVGRAIKNVIEKNAQNPQIKALNESIGDYAEMFRILSELEKQTLRKGQLGRYVLQGIGTGIGTSAAGPAGGILGALGGDIVTNILQKYKLNPPMQTAIIKYIQKYRPDLVDSVNKFIRQRKLDVQQAPRLPAGAIPTLGRQTDGVLPQSEARKRLLELGVPPEGYKRQLPAIIDGEGVKVQQKPIKLPPFGTVPRGIGNEPQAKNITDKIKTKSQLEDTLKKANKSNLGRR